MPILDGLQMIEQIRHNEIIQSIPIVVLTDDGSDTALEEAKRWGVEAFVVKPIKPEELKMIALSFG